MANDTAQDELDSLPTTPTYAVTDGDVYYGPYKSEDRAYRRKARWNAETDRTFTVVVASEMVEDIEYER